MANLKRYKSKIKGAIHELAIALHSVGAIDEQTMRWFDDSSLTPVHEFSARKIKAHRER